MTPPNSAGFLSLLLLFVAWFPLAAEAGDLGPLPESHILDRDGLFRSQPEIFQEISHRLVQLKLEHGMDVFLVIYSPKIGENDHEMAYRYQDEWLGPENDGLVFLANGSGVSNGIIGRSRPLYDGELISKGLTPRVEFHDFQRMVEKAATDMSGAEGVSNQIKEFTMSMVDQLEVSLAIKDENRPIKENYTLMGWMALILILMAVLVALASKVLGDRSDREHWNCYFPEFAMKKRLEARNGGGKLTCLAFGRGSSDDGQ